MLPRCWRSRITQDTGHESGTAAAAKVRLRRRAGLTTEPLRRFPSIAAPRVALFKGTTAQRTIIGGKSGEEKSQEAP